MSEIILIVEDDPSIAEALELIISCETPYDALVLKNGTEALEFTKGLTPSLFIFDYRLSDMSGIELYDRFQQISTLQGVPTIIISASLAMHIEEVNARGLTSLDKPFKVNTFLHIIDQTLISQKQAICVEQGLNNFSSPS